MCLESLLPQTRFLSRFIVGLLFWFIPLFSVLIVITFLWCRSGCGSWRIDRWCTKQKQTTLVLLYLPSSPFRSVMLNIEKIARVQYHSYFRVDVELYSKWIQEKFSLRSSSSDVDVAVSSTLSFTARQSKISILKQIILQTMLTFSV